MNNGTSEIDALLHRARTLCADGLPSKACTLFMQILQLDPGHAVAALEIAELLFHQLKQTERSLTYYDLAVRLDPENDRPVVAKSAALINMGRLQQAKETVDAFLLTPAFTPRGWLRKGLLLQTHERYPEAQKAYLKAASMIKDSPQNHEICCQAMFHLADLLGFMKRDQEAARWFAAYLRLRPNDADALKGYACVLNALGNNEQATSVLWHYLKLRPRESWPYLSLARIYGMEERKYNEAMDWLHKYEAGESSPQGRALAAQLKGEIEESRGRLKEAQTALETSLTLNDKDPHTYYCLARVLRQLGDKPKAMQMAKKASDVGEEETAYNMALERLQESMLLLNRAEPSIRQVLSKLQP